MVPYSGRIYFLYNIRDTLRKGIKCILSIYKTIKKNKFLSDMKRINFIIHKWRQILLLDISHCSSDEVIKTIDEAIGVIRSQPESSLLILTDVKDAGYDLEVIEKLKEFTGGNKPYVRASAVVGLDGLQKVVYNAVTLFSKRTLPVFDDIENAKDWLIEQ
jgi:hypothetical protein